MFSEQKTHLIDKYKVSNNFKCHHRISMNIRDKAVKKAGLSGKLPQNCYDEKGPKKHGAGKFRSLPTMTKEWDSRFIEYQ